MDWGGWGGKWSISSHKTSAESPWIEAQCLPSLRGCAQRMENGFPSLTLSFFSLSLFSFYWLLLCRLIEDGVVRGLRDGDSRRLDTQTPSALAEWKRSFNKHTGSNGAWVLPPVSPSTSPPPPPPPSFYSISTFIHLSSPPLTSAWLSVFPHINHDSRRKECTHHSAALQLGSAHCWTHMSHVQYIRIVQPIRERRRLMLFK